MPVPAEVGSIDRHDHEVSEPGRDVAAAPRTGVDLRGLERLDEPLLQLAEDLRVLHLRRSGSEGRSKEQCPDEKQDGDGDRRSHVDDVAGSAGPGALRIESHVVSIVSRAMRPHPIIPIVGLILLAACAVSPPPVPGADTGTADPVLVEGREVWAKSCASCHAPDGSGGSGPSMRAIVDRFPDPRDQVVVIDEGRGGMPAFGSRYSVAEIRAVVRYTREVL